MSSKLCVMCELSSTVDVMPVGKSLHKFGLLSRDIYHDLHKASVNEGIKWRCLLHSVNFQENKLARLALIELVRIENAKIADALDKSYFHGQIGCVCGLRASGPRLKRSNSLVNITDISIDHRGQSLFESGYFKFTDDVFAQQSSGQEKMKYMSLQHSTPPAQSRPKFRRRSRSLEILRPFIALNREVYVPKEDSDSDSEPDTDDEIAENVTSTNNNSNPDLKENTSGGIYNNTQDETDIGRTHTTHNTPKHVIPSCEQSSTYDDLFKAPCRFEQEVYTANMDDILNDCSNRTPGSGVSHVGTSASTGVLRTIPQDPEVTSAPNRPDSSKTANVDDMNDEPLYSMHEMQVSQSGKLQCSPSDATDWRIAAVIIIIAVILVIGTVYLVSTDLLSTILLYVGLEVYTCRHRPRPSRR